MTKRTTWIDMRLLEQIPACVKTLLLLQGQTQEGFNCDLDHPTDCELWLRLPGDTGQTEIEDHLLGRQYVVEYTLNRCWVYRGVHSDPA